MKRFIITETPRFNKFTDFCFSLFYITRYLLQRAVDSTLDDVCTSQTWLTLGKGLQRQAITTDENGTGREDLFRNVSVFPVGSTFDIHFQVIEEATSAVALRSGCYQFTISQ